MDFLTPLLDKTHSMAEGFMGALPNMGLGLIVLLLTWLAAFIVKKVIATITDKSNVRSSLKSLFQSLARVGVWIFGILVAMTIVFPSLTPAKMLTALGIGSVAIGFAFKDVFENFLAGILIMLRQPMRIGDHIECDDVEGNIEEITIRDTYVRRLDNELILVPNSYLFKNPVFVETDRPLRRYDVTCGVAYDVDADKAKQIIKETVENLDVIEKSKPVQVFAKEFKSSSIDFLVRWWAGSKPIDGHESKDVVIREIKKRLDKEGIEIPFPYRTLTFKEPLPINRSDKDE